MVFDASASIESKNFQSMKELARQIVAELDIGPDKTRVSLIHFSKFAYVDFNLTKYSSSDDVQQAINSANYTTGISGTTTVANLFAIPFRFTFPSLLILSYLILAHS